MKKILVAVVLLIAVATFAQTARRRSVGTPPNPAPLIPPLPYDVQDLIAYQGPISPTLQPLFDQFSWQTFVALNQPASPTAPNGPRIWETWASVNDVFHPGGTSPCGVQNAPGVKTLVMDSKNEHVDVIQSDFLQATQQPLIDRNLNFVLYEIRMNSIEEDYIRANNLNTYEGQLAFRNSGKTLQFPHSVDRVSYGSIEVKAAWRILNRGDDDRRYYISRANIAIDGSRTVDGKPVCAQNVIVGLVGLHIVRKTANHQDWIWSSFEQIDNVPNATDVPPSFFNAACANCPANTAPAKIGDEKSYLWEAQQPYAQRYAYTYNKQQYGTQVNRVYEIYPFTEGVTLQWWNNAAVKGTVWTNYQLIGSQWRAHGTQNPPKIEDIPNRLANTTMETYIQNDGSCLGCHENATTSVGQCADFSFVFFAAHLQKPANAPALTAQNCGTDTSFRARRN